MKRTIIAFSLIFLSMFQWAVPQAQAADVTLKLSPETVEIDTFYNGTNVKVSGVIPAGAEAVVRLNGEGEDLHLKKKGKIAGLLWMNTGDLTFHNAPKVYKLYTSKALADLDNSPAAEFGLAALINRIDISPAGEDKTFLIKEFVRLKKKEDLYSQKGDAVTFGAPEGGTKAYQAVLTIPSGMKQGTYTVDVAAVQDGRILSIVSAPLELKQISFPAALTKMAFGHAIWYGVMAVVVAILAGLFMGIVIKDKGGAH
jgi:uncharacterized protein (TIGR02186 family)